MQIETWLKIWCPSCKVPNWVCNGDVNDLTVSDVVGVRCYSCKHEFGLDGEDEFNTDEDYEPGRAAPR